MLRIYRRGRIISMKLLKMLETFNYDKYQGKLLPSKVTMVTP